MITRRIAAVTTSRADYGCLYPLLKEIEADSRLSLQLVVTGPHLSRNQGYTVAAIEADGFRVARRVTMMLDSDDGVTITKSVGLGLLGFADAWHDDSPDMVVCLGDRFELLAPVTAAYLNRTPVAHIHGGETTIGALDEGVRHAITKMASLHFPATEDYARRVVQLGESPDRVFMCGAPALDRIHQIQPVARDVLSDRLGLDLEHPTALVTLHPATLDCAEVDSQVDAVLEAIEQSDIDAVFTCANADPGGSAINDAVNTFCANNPTHYRVHANLGQETYFGCLHHLDVMVGNSSSGIIEAPSFGLPVVNVGTRQQGRVRASNVIDATCDAEAIITAIRRAIDPDFRDSLRGVANPYDPHGDGRAAFRIKEHLRQAKLGPALLAKRFHDVPGVELQ